MARSRVRGLGFKGFRGCRGLGFRGLGITGLEFGFDSLRASCRHAPWHVRST